MKTLTLDPSFSGLTTTGNFKLLFILFNKLSLVLLKEYVKNFGVLKLFLINIFLKFLYP